ASPTATTRTTACLTLSEGHFHFLFFRATDDFHLDLVARLVAAHGLEQVLDGFNFAVSHARDDVTGLEARLVCGTAFRHGDHARPFVVGRILTTHAQIAIADRRGRTGRPHAGLLGFKDSEHHVGIFAIPVEADPAHLARGQALGETAERLAAVGGLPD